MKWKVKVKVAQSCPTLCDPMDCTVHGTLQGRILEWVAFPFSRGSSQPRDQTQVSRIAGRFFTSWATREAIYSETVSFTLLLMLKCLLFHNIVDLEESFFSMSLLDKTGNKNCYIFLLHHLIVFFLPSPSS